jgi:hypothetical protein
MTEVVEAFNLCPWARSARLGGQVERRVLLHATVELEPALALLSDWAGQSELVIGLLLFPRLDLARSEFQHFVNRLIAVDAERCGTKSAPFALAAFHPAAALDLESADRLVPFLRRTPDPTIQVVRISALERVRRDEVAGTQFVDLRHFRLEHLPPPQKTLRERIGEHNLCTVSAEPVAVERVIDSILSDHEATRATLPQLRDTELG